MYFTSRARLSLVLNYIHIPQPQPQPPQPPPPPFVLVKVDSKGRLAVVEVRGKTVAQEHGQGLGPRSRSTFDLESQTEYKNYVAQELESKPLTMCVTHYVRWERTLAFESWIQDMFNTMSTFPVHPRPPSPHPINTPRYPPLYHL